MSSSEPAVAAPKSNPKKSRGRPTVKLVNPNMEAPPSVEKNIIIQPQVASLQPQVASLQPSKKKEKEERETCSICANYYTPIIRKKIVCKYCQHDTCSKCVENYLLSRHDDAHCMHCRVNYSDGVLRDICTKTYLQQSFFQHRQEVLINRSRAQLPGLQDEALRERRRRERTILITELRDEQRLMREERSELREEYGALLLKWHKLRINEASTPEEKEQIRNQKSDIRKEMEECDSKIKVKTDLMRDVQRNIHRLYYQNWHRQNDDGDNDDEDDNDATNAAADAAIAAEAAKKEEEKKRFIRRCIRDGCQGFLSQAWKCGMCEWYSCSKCFAVKGAEHDSPHECTAEALETATLIRKNCKPCPKCGEQIEHGGGCSQMWCISCQTPWDWNTGKIVTSGPIHNPLYYEWQRRMGGAVPRNPADIPCGGYPAHWELIRVPRGVNPFIADKFYEFFRICQELQTVARNQYQTHINQENNNQLHIRFLLNDFDEKIWGRQLAMLEKKKKRDTEIQEVFAAFHMVAIELINRIHHYRDGRRIFSDLSTKEAEDMIEKLDIEIQELIQMINQALQTISYSYSYSVPYIHVNDVLHYGAMRRFIRVQYKNFSHDVKKRRPKKDVMTETNNEVAAVAADATDAADAAAEEEEYQEEDEEYQEEEEEEDEKPQHHYDSDSDNSVASDIQAAIVASLQD